MKSWAAPSGPLRKLTIRRASHATHDQPAKSCSTPTSPPRLYGHQRTNPRLAIVVGVLENGKRRYFAYGSAGTSRPLDEHTVFEIGSMSKTFTALLLADAVVRGEVRLDEPVADLLPGGTVVPTFNSKPITLEALATHRSGLPRLPTNLKPANPADPYADYTASQLDSFLSTYKLPRAPGDSAEYSNLGFGFLGYALTNKQHATSWGALVQQRIADPLGMRETFVDVPAGDQARLSIGRQQDRARVAGGRNCCQSNLVARWGDWRLRFIRGVRSRAQRSDRGGRLSLALSRSLRLQPASPSVLHGARGINFNHRPKHKRLRLG